MSRLNEQQIGIRLRALPHWSKKDQTISRKFGFKDFLDSIDFVNRVAKIAEENDHHPDIEIHWNKVTLSLTTHSENGLTEKDFNLALECEKVFLEFLKTI
jgi:4a-hydroxytetrahydrobiopterin dehydratase